MNVVEPVRACWPSFFGRVTVASLLLVALAGTASGTANILSANGDDHAAFLQDFVEQNPKDQHQQLRGTNIYVMYFCYYTVEENKDGTCLYLRDISRRYRYIKFIEVAAPNRDAINLSVTRAKYAQSYQKYSYAGCAAANRPFTEITVSPGLDKLQLESCFAISTLIHLGFDVRSLVSGKYKDINLDEILPYYMSGK